MWLAIALACSGVAETDAPDGLDTDALTGARLSGTVAASTAAGYLIGEAAGDYAGTDLAAGDATGDGVPELLIIGGGPGLAWLWSGPPSGAGNLADAHAQFGWSDRGDGPLYAPGIGDVTGDGQGDVVLTSPGAWDQAGRLYAFRGPVAAGDHDVKDADVVIDGVGDDFLGIDVAVGSDATGDGLDDVLVGAMSMEDGGGAYLLAGPITTGDARSRAATTLRGAPGDAAGGGVAFVGDVDGDGVADLAVGAQDAAGGLGAVYVVAGPPPSGTFDLSAADAIWTGETAGDGSGRSVAAAGDVDGDGTADVFTGTLYNNESSTGGAGRGYLLFGGAWGGAASLSTAGVVFAGVSAGDRVGYPVGPGGDHDGDGHADLLLGASGSDLGGTDSGATYVVYGSGSLSGSFALSSADAVIVGAPGGYLGGLADPADYNADGYDDFAISAPWADDVAPHVGTIFVWYGGP